MRDSSLNVGCWVGRNRQMCQLLESGNRSTFRAPTLLQLFSTWHSLKSWKTKRIAVLLQLFCWSTAAGTLHGSQNESYDRVVALGCFEWNCKTCSSSARLLFWGFGFWLEPDWDRDRCWEVSCRCRRIIALERDSTDYKCVLAFEEASPGFNATDGCRTLNYDQRGGASLSVSSGR